MNKPKIIAAHSILFNKICFCENTFYDVSNTIAIFGELSLTTTNYASILPEVHKKAISDILNFKDKELFAGSYFFVPLSKDITPLYIEAGFDVTFLYPNVNCKFEYFINQFGAYFSFYNHERYFDTKVIDKFSLLQYWDKYQSDIEELITKYKSTCIELQGGETLNDYYDINDRVLHLTPMRRLVEVSFKDYYVYEDDGYPDNDNLSNWINWLTEVLNKVPEEYRSSVEWEKQEETVMITYRRPETDEEMLERKCRHIEFIDDKKQKYYDMQQLMKITF